MRALAPALALALLLPGCPHDLSRGDPSKDLAISEAGVAPLTDAGAEAWLDACVPSNGGVEVCDGLDNDCNGAADDGFDLKTDPANCGACGQVCKTPNATATCLAGVCTVGACDKDTKGNSTHWNTDGDWRTGCDYACKITSGGHEVCDAKDNDCDKKTDEECDKLILLYRFGDVGTIGNWPTVHNMAGNQMMGTATSAVQLVSGSQLAGVPGEGSDGYAAKLDGLSAEIKVTPTKNQQVLDCESTTGWGSHKPVVKLDYKNKREGFAAVRVTAHTNVNGFMAQYNGATKDLSSWKNGSNGLDGYLTFWVFIKDTKLSKLRKVKIGNSDKAKYASWDGLDSYVLGPALASFSSGWNLLALPFAKASYDDKANIDWFNVKLVELFTNVNNDATTTNFFIFDDFRMEKDLSQRYTRFTVMAWVKLTKLKGQVYIFHKQDDLPGMGTDPTGNQWWFIAANNVSIYSTPTVKAGSWAHLAMTYDGTIFSAYQDGKLVGKAQTGFAPGKVTRLGTNGMAGRFLQGLVDEVAIYRRAMGQTELQRYVGLFSP